MKLRIPWKLQVTTSVVYQYIRSALSRLGRPKENGINISFYCKYHQTTGASVAIASIANHLASQHNVDAYIKPLSGYSRMLDLSVRQYFSPNALSGRLFVVDIEQDNDIIVKLIAESKQVILTCHALPTVLHGVPQDQLIKNLASATYIHFVSRFQCSEFINHYPQINIESKSFVIPNYTRQSSKHGKTHNIGIVGHLNRKAKNALRAIQLAQQSNAHLIQCWGSEAIHGLDDKTLYSKLRINGWTDNPMAMHNTFDVLLSTSEFETFGLVVAEALSAGIPCVLSDIPVFRELYAECKGVVILTGDDDQDIQSINRLLETAPVLKHEIIAFWETHFSNQTVKQAWLAKIAELSSHEQSQARET